MAKPQTEQGYTRIANELLDALAGSPMSSTGYAVVLLVIRNTYGWNKQSAPFSWAGIARSIAANERNVRREGQRLVECGVLRVTESGQIGLQKDYEQWGKLAPNRVNSPGRVRPSGRARQPVNEGEFTLLNRASLPYSTVELKTERHQRQERQANGPISFEEQERQRSLEAALVEDAKLRDRTRSALARA